MTGSLIGRDQYEALSDYVSSDAAEFVVLSGVWVFLGCFAL